jgi:hypothetical protein
VGSPFSGCVKSETGKKRPSAKIDGTRSRALRGATGVKNGVKSGGFWQPLSQDVALCWKKVFGKAGLSPTVCETLQSC